MLKVIGCITVQHDWRLVLVAALVCSLISFVATAMFRRAETSEGLRKWSWLGGTSLVTGAGVWATHFIAMLAYEYQIERGIDGFLTLGSGLIGVAFSAAAYSVMVFSKRHIRIVAGGVLLGTAISALHYVGMAAYSVGATLSWDVAYISASVVLSILFSTAMFWALCRENNGLLNAAAPVLLFLAIVLMHFTGMTALTLVPTMMIDTSVLIIEKTTVTVGVIAVSIMMALIGLVVLAFDNRLVHQKAKDADKLKVLNTQLEAALVRAEASAKSKSDFLANMSHEIRTPMNGIIGMTEVLMNTNLDKNQREYAHLVLSSANGLMRVLNDILDFSKLEAGKMRLSPSCFNLRRMVEEVVATMQAHASAQDMELIVRYSPTLPGGVVGDEGRIRQVLANLIGNAVKFTKYGHVFVNVEGERDAGGVSFLIEVEDTGIGIAEEQVDHIFEKFEQADTSRSRRYEGTGLGLAISKELVELMEGSIGVRSVLEKGSTFWVKLHLPVDDKVTALAVADPDVFSDLRVLAVDDNYVNRRLLQEILAGKGIEATIVASAREAFTALEQSHMRGAMFDLLLTDYHMPEENGDELTRRIQQDERFKTLLCVMLSSVDVEKQPDEECAERYAAWVTKPIRAAHLMDTILGVLSESSIERLKTVEHSLNTTERVEPDEGRQNGPYILVAEDNVVNQRVLEAYLANVEYEVVMVENGREAVDAYLRHPPVLILMDVSMPVMDGLMATREIRRIEEETSLARVSIIGSTAHVLEQDRKACMEAGMDDFIAKPIRMQTLNEVVLKWLPSEETPLGAIGVLS
ncbi:response regulator [Kiloniella laminariae]|uniref:response regulator n=1 Tax=Kiloniella laminariae TaxID=454162 RepID=UPI00036D2847|nr:response regulator [Kiloniella laminariae]